MTGRHTTVLGAALIAALTATGAAAQPGRGSREGREWNRQPPQPSPWAAMGQRDGPPGPRPFERGMGMQERRADLWRQAMQRRAMAQRFMQNRPGIREYLKRNPEARQKLRDAWTDRRARGQQPQWMQGSRAGGPPCCPRCPYGARASSPRPENERPQRSPPDPRMRKGPPATERMRQPPPGCGPCAPSRPDAPAGCPMARERPEPPRPREQAKPPAPPPAPERRPSAVRPDAPRSRKPRAQS